MDKISRGQVPPMGWRYFQNDILIEGTTANDLIEKVTEHRESNNFEAGDPWQEIQDQICSRYPGACFGQTPAPQVMSTTAFERFKSFASTLLRHVTMGGDLVDQNTANTRGGICQSCHNNVASSQSRGGCATCGGGEDAAIGVMRKQILQTRSTPYDSSLKTCAICSCDLRLKVWFRREVLGVSDENENAWPRFCWLKSNPQ